MLYERLIVPGLQNGTCAYRLAFNKCSMAELLWAHVVYMRDWQTVQSFADELNLVSLHIPHHHDLCLCLQTWNCIKTHSQTASNLNLGAVRQPSLPHRPHLASSTLYEAAISFF